MNVFGLLPKVLDKIHEYDIMFSGSMTRCRVIRTRMEDPRVA